jgi:Protein of unknown function (DUF2849)
MSKKIKYPAILIAHDLLGGHVVYWGNNGWQVQYAGAIIANNDQDADDLGQIITQEIAKNIVVDAELVSVEIKDEKIIPDHFRVKIKMFGPTINYGIA